LSKLETKKQTEFDLLLSGRDLDSASSDTYPLSQILKQKVEYAVTQEAESALKNNKCKTALATLQNLCSKIPSTIFTKYERAGKNYVTIEHNLGDSGNLFFDEIFDRSIQAKPISDHHTITQKNKICFIFRQ
jgi:hypothetical protein